jgi:hypothetical protein
MAKITGLKAVEQGIALSFVPLRSGPAAGVHATEKTSLADGAKKGMKMHGMIDGAIDDINLGEGLVDYVPDGCVDIRLRSARSFKANHLGIYELRVLEEHLEFIKQILVDLGCVVFESIVEDLPDGVYEIVVESEVFPGSVIDQIHKQTSLHAYFKRDLAAVGDKAFIYQVVMDEDSELMDTVNDRGWLVELGKFGRYTMRQAKKKIEYESLESTGNLPEGSAEGGGEGEEARRGRRCEIAERYGWLASAGCGRRSKEGARDVEGTL